MRVDWKIFTDAKEEKNARTIYNKIEKQFLVPVLINKYEKNYKDNTQIIYFKSEHNEMGKINISSYRKRTTNW